MKLKLNIYTSIICFLLIGISSSSLFATKASSSINAGEQKKAEKGLKDNKYFIYYINASITNTGSTEQKQSFEEAIKHNMVAQFYYLRFSFHESYVEVRKTQSILITLYRSNLDEEIEKTRSYLHKQAPAVIYSEDSRARLYISLSYRLLKHARIYMGMADNYKESLYSLRLYKYMKAMKKLKEAKRYAVTTTLQNSIPDKQKLRREHQTYQDITDLINEYVPEDQREELLAYHRDSYYEYNDTMSIYDRVWDEADLDHFEPYQEYLEKTD